MTRRSGAEILSSGEDLRGSIGSSLVPALSFTTIEHTVVNDRLNA